MDKQYYLGEIRARLSPKRYEHSVNVAKAAVRLAKKYGANPEQAELAGILHDITKETEPAVPAIASRENLRAMVFKMI